MIVNIVAAGILSAILAAVMLAPAHVLRRSNQLGVARRTQAQQRRQAWPPRPVKHAS